jgi:hypothetical protein
VLVRTGLAEFSSPVWEGKHPALVLGWRDDQLAPVVALLKPFMPDSLTSEMQCAVAACARSLVVNIGLTGQPVRYSRSKPHYSRPKRYRQGHRYYSHYYVTRAMDLLQRAGLTGGDLGVWAGGRQSIAWPTAELLELLDPVIDAGEPRAEPYEAEAIVLRDRTDKTDVDYDDTDDTVAMRAQVETLNEALGQVILLRLGTPFPIPLVRRVFNGGFDRGGRFYCHGPSFQNIPSQDRLDLQFVIDGAVHPVVEIDYASLHITMAYTEAGLSVPPGDQYAIDGFDRTLVKEAVNILLNATTRHKAVSALSEALHDQDYALWERSGLDTRWRAETRPLAERVVSAVEDMHDQIAGSFGSDCGARYQRKDSDMATQVMLRMIDKTGRCPLPVHDSFVVADIDHSHLDSTMREVASEEGLTLHLKSAGGSYR